jgi:hypothetical protein
MTTFVHTDFPVQHPGVVRAEHAVERFKQATQPFEGARGVASLLLAALVSTLVVVVNQVIETWSEGHLLAAWIALWLIVFSALAMLAKPVRRLTHGMPKALQAWRQARFEARQAALMWQAAQVDPRLMADLQRAVSASQD